MKPVFFCLLLVLFSCSIPTIRTTTLIENDQFEPLVKFTSPEWSFNGGSAFLRSWTDKKDHSLTTHQVYIHIKYYGSDWRFYKWAYLRGGLELKVVDINSKVVSCSSGNCTYYEDVGVMLSDQLLRNNSDGLYFKLIPKAGESIVFLISKDHLSKQLAAIDSVTPNL